MTVLIECPRCGGSGLAKPEPAPELAELASYIRANQQLARSLYEATEPLLHGTAGEQVLGRELRERHGLEV